MEGLDGKPGAVILGGSFHSLGAARNLAKHGVPVCVVDNGACVSRFSRAVTYFIACPAVDDEEAYIQFLLSAAVDKGMEGWVLFPSPSGYTLISWRRESLQDQRSNHAEG